MLKRIHVDQLRLGMYIAEFCGSWMEHPFVRAKLLLAKSHDLAKIRASSIREVWIDSSRGLDVSPGVAVVSAQQVDTAVEASLQQLGKAVPVVARVPIDMELQRAARICGQAKQAVIAMFQEARMGNVVDASGAQGLVESISESLARNPAALISIARIKTVDDYTYLHSVAVCALMVALARQLGFEQARISSAGLAGLLHDLGKAAVPSSILNKPGNLTFAEFAVVRDHPAKGYDMLRRVGGMDQIAMDVCLHHHEKTDGSGYPKGLKAEEISLLAKMGAVCDVYDAITSNRPYRQGWDPADALRKMAEWAPGHFDASVFQAFVKCVGIYPVGSLVSMKSGRIGVVVEQSDNALTKPKVKLFFSIRAGMRIPAEIHDLSRADSTERIVAREDPAKWRFPDLHELWSGIEGLGHPPTR